MKHQAGTKKTNLQSRIFYIRWDFSWQENISTFLFLTNLCTDVKHVYSPDYPNFLSKFSEKIPDAERIWAGSSERLRWPIPLGLRTEMSLQNIAKSNNFHFYYCLNLDKKGKMVCSTKEKNKCYNNQETLKVFLIIVILPNLEMELAERVREYGNIAEDLLGKSRRKIRKTLRSARGDHLSCIRRPRFMAGQTLFVEGAGLLFECSYPAHL